MNSQKQYDGIIGEVHTEFMTIAETLPESAKAASKKAALIVEDLEKNNLQKIERLEKVGMKNVAQVRDCKEVRMEMEIAVSGASYRKMLCESLTHFKTTYPTFKVITERQIQEVCEKYGLIVGRLERFVGFIPEKNLKELEDFIKADPIHRDDKNDFHRENLSGCHSNTLGKIFEIAAPAKDMNAKPSELKDGYRIVDDPVIFYPMKNGFFCIVTAWGNEASDPVIVNEKLN